MIYLVMDDEKLNKTKDLQKAIAERRRLQRELDDIDAAIHSHPDYESEYWSAHYSALMEFRDKYRHFDIPLRYKVDGLDLGRFSKLLKQNFHENLSYRYGVQHNLHPEAEQFFIDDYFEKLCKEGYEGFDNYWSEARIEYVGYLADNHTPLIPNSFKSKISEKGIQLGPWCHRQRNRYFAGTLPTIEYLMLEGSNFLFNIDLRFQRYSAEDRVTLAKLSGNRSDDQFDHDNDTINYIIFKAEAEGFKNNDLINHLDRKHQTYGKSFLIACYNDYRISLIRDSIRSLDDKIRSMANKISVIKKNREELAQDFKNINIHQDTLNIQKKFHLKLKTILIELTDTFKSEPSKKVLDVSDDIWNYVKHKNSKVGLGDV